MNHVFDPLNLLILAVAVVIFFKLRSMLGRRTGNERPPLDLPLPRRADNRALGEPSTASSRDATGGAVSPSEPAEPVWAGFAEPGTPLAAGLEKIAAADSRFSPRAFLEGAKLAYEMIVSAFAQGDKSGLRNLVSKDVFDGFAGAIDMREREGQRMESRFVGFEKADIHAADLIGRRAQVTVRFISQLISATFDRSGQVIDGDPKQIREVNDVWTFERDVSSRDPNWRLVATEAQA
jgi:predicted lipid-binding transport protein (Tim44 family)